MKQKFFLFFNSLRFRLIMLVMLAVVPALFITYNTGLEHRRLAREKSIEDAYRYTRLAASYHGSLIENTRQLLTYLALQENEFSPGECGNFLRNLSQSYTAYTSISVYNPEGDLYCSTMSFSGKVSISDYDFFQQARQTGKFTIGTPTIGRLSSRIIIPLIIPVLNEQNEVSAFLSASLDLENIFQYTNQLGLPPDSAILVVDDTGKIIFRYPDTQTWTGQSLPNSPIIQNILSNQGEGNADVRGVDGVPRLYAFTSMESAPQSELFFSIGIPTAIAYASADRLLWVNTISIFGAALLAMAAAWLFGDVLVLRIVSLTTERDQAENELRALNTQLEMRVALRTSELAEVNQKLQIELGERQRVVEALRLRELELKKTNNLLQQSNRDLQDFAYIASHDLQEPLRKIQAFGERLTKRFNSELSAEGQDYADRMVAAANRMQTMINDLLAYSRVSTKGHQFQRVSLNKIVQEVITDLELRIRETGGRVMVSDLPEIDADPMQIHQLMLNLIGNALKFHRPDVPPEIKVCSEVTTGEIGREAMITLIVEDNGIGFNVKYLEKIFQPFQRLHDRSHFDGSGIGLAICRKIVERHGGEIDATSEPDQGSRFIVQLPVKQKIND